MTAEVSVLERAYINQQYHVQLREAAYTRRWDVADVTVVGGLDGNGHDAVLYEAEAVMLLDRGWLTPGTRLIWQGVTYRVRGCEMWPEWLEREL